MSKKKTMDSINQAMIEEEAEAKNAEHGFKSNMSAGVRGGQVKNKK